MRITGVLVALGLTAVVQGCASTPTGPSVMVLPGTGKTMEQFQTDDGRCRQMATAELQREGGGPVPRQQRYDMTYMQCMYAAGHQIPGSRAGYSAPSAGAPATRNGIGQPPPPPAGTPPPPPPGPSR